MAGDKPKVITEIKIEPIYSVNGQAGIPSGYSIRTTYN